MEVNANSLGGRKEGTVFDAANFAGVFAKAHAQKDRSFLGASFGRVFSAEMMKAKKSARVCADLVFAVRSFMTFAHMGFLRKPLKIVSVVIGLVVVFVMDNLCSCRSLKPAEGHKTVKQTVVPSKEIPVIAHMRLVWRKAVASFSKNFPAPGNCVQMRCESILDSLVDVCGQHLRPFLGGYGLLTSLSENQGNR